MAQPPLGCCRARIRSAAPRTLGSASRPAQASRSRYSLSRIVSPSSGALQWPSADWRSRSQRVVRVIASTSAESPAVARPPWRRGIRCGAGPRGDETATVAGADSSEHDGRLSATGPVKVMRPSLWRAVRTILRPTLKNRPKNREPSTAPTRADKRRGRAIQRHSPQESQIGNKLGNLGRLCRQSGPYATAGTTIGKLMTTRVPSPGRDSTAKPPPFDSISRNAFGRPSPMPRPASRPQ